MTTELPIACSLDAGGLERRLADISAIGAKALISHNKVDNRNVLRFRPSAGVKSRLRRSPKPRANVAVSSRSSLGAQDDDLVLSVSAPGEAEALADEFATLFSGVPA